MRTEIDHKTSLKLINAQQNTSVAMPWRFPMNLRSKKPGGGRERASHSNKNKNKNKRKAPQAHVYSSSVSDPLSALDPEHELTSPPESLSSSLSSWRDLFFGGTFLGAEAEAEPALVDLSTL